MKDAVVTSLFVVTTVISITQGAKLRCTERTNGYCYLLRNNPLSWSDAIQDCQAFTEDDSPPGSLMAVYDADAQNALENIISTNNLNEDLWSGGVLMNSLNLTGYPEELWRWLADEDDLTISTVCDSKQAKTKSKDTLSPNALDITFFIDTSGSISDTLFTAVKNFVKNVINSVNIGVNDVQVAIITFGNQATLQCDLDDKVTADELVDLVNSLTSAPENTHTYDALTLVNTVFSKRYGDRLYVPNVAIGITDGKPTLSEELTTMATEINHNEAIRTFMIGVGSEVDETVVRELSSSPHKLGENYFLETDINIIESTAFSDEFLGEICDWQQRLQLMELPAVTGQGCFKDWTVRRDLPHQVTPTGDVTPPTCVTSCRDAGYAYAGLQSSTSGSDKCYCGNEFGYNGTSTECTSRCQDDPSYFCGGTNSLSVFKVGDDPNFTLWDLSGSRPQPDNANGDEFCASMTVDDSIKMSDNGCRSLKRYMCDLPSIENCQGTDYYSVAWPEETCLFLSPDVKPWFLARQVCNDLDGDLVTLNTQQKYNGIKAVFDKLDTDVWVGLYKVNFIFDDERGGTEFKYNNFREAGLEPDFSNGNCVAVQTPEGTWYMDVCSTPRRYICQIAVTANPSTTAISYQSSTVDQNQLETNANDSTTTSVDTTSTSVTTLREATTSDVSTSAAASTESAIVTTIDDVTDGSTTAADVQGPGTAGASTNEDNGLDIIYIILIVILCLLILCAIIFAILFLYFKKRNKKSGVVSPTTMNKYDARPKAPIPEGGYVFDPYEGYSDAGSTTAFAY